MTHLSKPCCAPALYTKKPNGRYTIANDDEVVNNAIHVIDALYDLGNNTVIHNPKEAIEQLYLRMHREHEVFVVMFLNSNHRIITVNELFRGSIAHTNVPVREVIKEALKVNAGAAIVAHNHPSGTIDPSIADKRITEALYHAFNLMDIRLLDHFIFGAGGADNAFSFAENGLLPIP